MIKFYPPIAKGALLALSLFAAINMSYAQCNAELNPNNMITNGDFEGSASANISDYDQGSSGPGSWHISQPVDGGSYRSATVNGQPGDHTKGNTSGHYMLIDVDDSKNSDGSLKRAWYTTVTVQPNTTYFFSAYIANINTKNRNPSQLKFYVGNTDISNGTIITPPGAEVTDETLADHSWGQFYTSWNSGSTSGPVVISMKNILLNGTGNDLALDDITFSTSCKWVNQLEKSHFPTQVPVCNNQPVTLDPGITDNGTFSWFKDNLITPAPGTNNGKTYQATSTGTYYFCYVINSCARLDTANVVNANIPLNPIVVSPAQCVGNGTITLKGLVPNQVYELSYTYEGGATITGNKTADNLGQIIITGKKGWYRGIQLKANGCTSPTKDVQLQDPKGLTLGWNGQVYDKKSCGGDWNVKIYGVTRDLTYAVQINKNGVISNTSVTANSSNDAYLQLDNTPAGNYIFTVTDPTTACPSSISLDLLTQDIPTISIKSSVNPACHSNNGKIILTASDFVSGTNYTLNYTKDGTSMTGIPFKPTSASFDVEIPNLGAGDYSASVVIASKPTCPSNSVQVTLSEPPAPSITAATSTDASCEDNDGKISLVIANTVGGKSYEINYKLGGVAQTKKTVNAAGTTLNADLTLLKAGAYTDITVNEVGSSCISTGKTATINKPAIPTISAQGHNPSDCGATDGKIDIAGSNFIQGAVYTITYTEDAEAAKTLDLTATSTTSLGSLTALVSGAYTKISVTEKGKNCKSNESQATLAAPSSPAITSIDDTHGPTNCNGSDGKLILNLNNLKAGTVYVIHYMLGGGSDKTLEQTASAATQQWTIPNLTAGSYSNIYVIEKGKVCQSPASTATLSDPPALTITLQNTVAPSCVGGDGSFDISVSPTVSGKTYELSYSIDGGSPQTKTKVATGDPSLIQLTSLPAGAYSNITVKEQGKACGSNVEAFTWTTPPIPSIVLTFANPTTCGGADGSISLVASNLTIGKAYDVTYKKDNVPASSIYTASATTGTINISSLSQGSYTDVTISEAGKNCKAVAQQATLTDPTAPSISVSGTDPTACGATDGTLTIKGLSPSTTYNIAYNNGSDVPLANKTSDASGNFVITGLGIGIFTKITATVNNCKSNEVTFALVNPNVPQITATPSDPTTCGGNNGGIVITGLTNGNTYDISYSLNSGPTVTLANQTISGGQVSISSLAAGSYTQIKAKLVGTPCESPEVTTTLKDPSRPIISGTVGHDPITCQGAEGSFEIAGLTGGKAYNVSYVNGSAVNVPNILANASGVVNIPSLKAGSYSSITVTDAVTLCVSDPADPVVIVDPAAPIITLKGNDPTVCAGNGSLEIGQLVANTAFQVFYEDPTSTGPLAFTSDANGVILVPAPAGTYTNVKVTLNNCSSNTLSATLVDPIDVPSVSIDASALKICEGMAVTFKAQPVAGGTAPSYEWYLNNLKVGDATAVYSNNALQDNDEVKVVLTSSASCASPKTAMSAPVNIKVISYPVPSITGDTSFCAGSSNLLSAVGGSATATYQWYNTSGNAIGGAIQKTLSVTTEGTYAVEIKEDICPAKSLPFVSKMVTVVVSAGADQELLLEDMNQQDVLIYLQGSGNGTKHLWTSSPSAALSDPTIYNPETILTPCTYTFVLADSIGKCGASDEVMVAIYTKVRIPNAFSPNGDGKNENWVIDGLEKYPNTKVKVFNRWGSAVFTDNYGYRVPWDGTSGGTLMASGTYYYVIELKGSGDGKEEVRTGSLTIVR